ncbi:MAG TPA: hypothetical protein VNZ45_09890, partial [Bacteroidia bacterium]|nr:hypothetical protein [Bacteroidia bacterium]
MDKRIRVISIVFGATVLVVIAYTIYLIITLESSASIELLFLPFFAAGWLYFIECIILFIIFIKHLKKVWFMLLPIFLISSIVPIYFLNTWLDKRPVEVPKPAKLPVSMEEYINNRDMIIKDYRTKDLDSTNHLGQLLVTKVDIDTIIYSLDKTKFFGIIIIAELDKAKEYYCSEYRIGMRDGNIWK